MEILGRRRRRRPLLVGYRDSDSSAFLFRFSRRSFFRVIIISLAAIALLPPIVFHFRLRTIRQVQLRRCSWLKEPPLVCAHGGDSTKAFANTMAAYRLAIHSQVDCIEIDVSRTSDGALLSLHDRDLQRISGDRSFRVGQLSMKEIRQLEASNQSAQKVADAKILTAEEALMLISGSVRRVILDAKVGPPSHEYGLAQDILSIVERTQCKNCLIWAKSDSLVKDIIKQSSNMTVGYIIMKDPSTGRRSNLWRVKGAEVVGVYHPLIDDKLVRVLHRGKKKVYAWTVDDMESMQKMLFEHVDAIVTSNPTLLQNLMQDLRTQCLEEEKNPARGYLWLVAILVCLVIYLLTELARI